MYLYEYVLLKLLVFYIFSEYINKESKLLMYIGDFSRQLDYLHKLITIIDVHNLTQVGTFYLRLAASMAKGLRSGISSPL